ncbi:MAG: zinc ribbon domain-containing protein [Oscillospiraceae bacterium]|jgi:hypothetical protein|nr:zinc ribbon domain-containing protein [Oscillospiraceae bacterium]
MHCSYCSNHVTDGAVFCQHCGAPTGEQQAAQPVRVPQNYAPPQPGYAPPRPGYTPKKSNAPILVVLIAVFTLFFIVGGLMLVGLFNMPEWSQDDARSLWVDDTWYENHGGDSAYAIYSAAFKQLYSQPAQRGMTWHEITVTLADGTAITEERQTHSSLVRQADGTLDSSARVDWLNADGTTTEGTVYYDDGYYYSDLVTAGKPAQYKTAAARTDGTDPIPDELLISQDDVIAEDKYYDTDAEELYMTLSGEAASRILGRGTAELADDAVFGNITLYFAVDAYGNLSTVGFVVEGTCTRDGKNAAIAAKGGFALVDFNAIESIDFPAAIYDYPVQPR